MSRLGKIDIPPKQAEKLLVLANRLEKKRAARAHKWHFNCLSHQYFALYTVRQDLIRCRCRKCSYYKDNQCTYTKAPGEDITQIEDIINLSLYLSAVDRGIIKFIE